MSAISTRPDISTLEVPRDAWSAPFWEAASEHRLVFPLCASCGRYRWPPGPFCPACRSQEVSWAEAGEGLIFSYTILGPAVAGGGEGGPLVPSLIEFPAAGGVRLIAALVDSPIDRISIGARVAPVWVAARDAILPMFRLAEGVS